MKQFGFNVISYVSGNLGIGVTARNVVRVLQDKGCSLAILDLDPGLGRKDYDRTFESLQVGSIDQLPYGVNLIILPPVAIGDLLPSILTYKPGCLNVGFCMWELPILPMPWIPHMQALDVLVAQTHFIRYAFEFNLSNVKTISAVHPIYLPDNVKPDRARFGLPTDGVIFLTGFEPCSDPQRKNPFATIRAFLEEVGQDPRAHLVIKFNNALQDGVPHPIVLQLEEVCANHPRIHFITDVLSYGEVLSLYASCDIFVSLHRAEGLGLAPMEAMALGRPVIATAWSGNMSYMDHTNACLVDYKLIPVDGSISHYSKEVLGRETVWADADVAGAAVWMRRLLESPELRRSIGERAACAMRAHHEQALRGGFIDELKSIWDHHEYMVGDEHERSQGKLRAREHREEGLSKYIADVSEGAWNARYLRWREKHAFTEADRHIIQERLSADGVVHPVVHVLVSALAGAEALLADTLDSLGSQIYTNWKLSIVTDAELPSGALGADDKIRWCALNAGDSTSCVLSRAVSATGADWVLHLEAGDTLEPQMLAVCVSYLNVRPEWRLLYADEDSITPNGEHVNPCFKPDVNLDLLRSTAYVGNAVLVQRELFVQLGGWSLLEGVANHDLTFKVIDQCGETAIGHIPQLLFHRHQINDARYTDAVVEANGALVVREHLSRCGISAKVAAGLLPRSYFIEYDYSREPMVSIIIPTRDKLDLLRPCVESVLNKTAYPNFEVVIVDNNSTDSATLSYLTQLPAVDSRVRVLSYPGQYNFSAINNAAAREARGEYLLLLNNDTVVVQPQWLDRMMMYGQRPDVGIVGPRLVFPNGNVQHAGIIAGMGLYGVSEHVNIGLPMKSPGYMGRSQMSQNMSLVTAACMLVRANLYRELGGFDDGDFKVLFNDVDFCLKAKRRGLKIVWTPYATLVHHGSVSLKSFTDAADQDRSKKELDAIRTRWLPELANDPAFNRHLSLLQRNVSIEIDVDATWDPVFRDRTRVFGCGAGSYGSWQYRLGQPLAAMRNAGVVQSALCAYSDRRIRLPTVAELERLAPDVMLLHNTLHDTHLSMIADYRRHYDGLIVFGEDDLMFALPQKNQFSKRVYKDMKKRFRRCLSLCDRLVVTTEPLGMAFEEMIEDVRVLPNYLDGTVWGHLRSDRRHGGKPRVGWAGATQHRGDLELLIAVVKETSREIDWVFFGMCPPEIQSLVAEFHPPVSFEKYPAKLASLDLDLALAPLEHNNFNEAKSNLRLLEYGFLGWPVIASDIDPYRGAPVCLVPNNPSAWTRAIREHVSDMDALGRAGDALQIWVKTGWLLEDHMEDWLAVLNRSDSKRPDLPARGEVVSA